MTRPRQADDGRVGEGAQTHCTNQRTHCRPAIDSNAETFLAWLSARAVRLSFAWLLFWAGVVVGWVATVRGNPMGLNEWGDWLAGVSAPLAFFWLVLGYYHQREELRLQREDLRLQRRDSRALVQQNQRQAQALEEQIRARFVADSPV